MRPRHRAAVTQQHSSGQVDHASARRKFPKATLNRPRASTAGGLKRIWLCAVLTSETLLSAPGMKQSVAARKHLVLRSGVLSMRLVGLARTVAAGATQLGGLLRQVGRRLRSRDGTRSNLASDLVPFPQRRGLDHALLTNGSSRMNSSAASRDPKTAIEPSACGRRTCRPAGGPPGRGPP
jgi:hypothetical protein